MLRVMTTRLDLASGWRVCHVLKDECARDFDGGVALPGGLGSALHPSLELLDELVDSGALRVGEQTRCRGFGKLVSGRFPPGGRARRCNRILEPTFGPRRYLG